MNDQEKKEIENLPPKYQPLGAWSYFGYNLLFALPVVGWIFIIVFALNDSNINRRSFARSFFCVWIITIVILVILLVVGGGMMGVLGSMQNR